MKSTSMRSLAMAVAVTGVLGAMAAPANAVAITWSNGTFSNVSILPDAGSVVYAITGGGYADVTVGGITFLNRNEYDYWYTNPYVDITRQHQNGGFLNGRSSGNSNFDAVLDTAMYDDNYPLMNGAITLKGLASGTTYQVLLLDAFDGGTPYGLTLTMQGSDGLGNDSAAQQYSYASGPLGGYVLGTFIADAATQSLSLNTPVYTNFQLNALVVSKITIPEPASLSVLALGAVGLLARRRRKA